MEGLILLVCLLVIWLIAAPIVALVKASQAKTEARETQVKLDRMERGLQLLQRETRLLQMAFNNPQSQPGPPSAVVPDQAEEAAVALPRPAVPPPIRPPVVAPQGPIRPSVLAAPREFEPLVPEPAISAEVEPGPTFSLEQFMGVKLFAWLGGIALFFGVIFFVKYAFENNWISPVLRVTLGFVTGTSLLAGGLALHRKGAYQVLAQALCATAVLILYGVTFAAHAFYRLEAFDTVPTFALMVLITVVAFLIAVRLDALVVGVLGMLGGFLTPVLVHTGRDQPLGLFGYIGLLVIGLLAVSRHRRWGFLVSGAAVGTGLMLIAWFAEFFVAGYYAHGSRIWIPMGILVSFNLLFLASAWLEQRRGDPEIHAAGSTLALSALSMIFAFVMLAFGPVAERMPLLYGFILLENLVVLAVVWLQPKLLVAQLFNALLTFWHLTMWTGAYLTAERLGMALVVCLVFGGVHAMGPVLLARFRPEGATVISPKLWPWMALLTQLLILLHILHLPDASLLVWAAVILTDLLVIALAAATGAMLPVLASLLLSLVLAGVWLLHAPLPIDALSPFLLITTGMAAVFALAGRWLREQPALADGAADSRPTLEQQMASGLPVLSGVMPFALLILVIQRLTIANPSAVFGVGLLMAILLIAMARFNRQGVLVPVALGCILAVEAVWHGAQFDATLPGIPLAWYLGLYLMFLILPFVFHRVCEAQVWPWMASALTGVGHFLLIHHLVSRAFPAMAGNMGLLPVAFALPSLLALYDVVRRPATSEDVQRGRLAWFGGVALLFITLIFPIQFERYWLTVSWALEGALLLGLHRRVAHAGLLLAGLGLLGTAFVRLTLNPAIFSDYPRGAVALIDWHLYTYGIVAAAQFLGAWWFSDPDERHLDIPARGLLIGSGCVLLFLLLNIEIAEWFTPPGDRCVAFNFGINFARDMSYSIAWGLFSLGLLGMGIRYGARPARYAAIGLLVVTLIKLFLHDLAAIGSIYRIGALIGVALIAFVASFLYQQFFNSSRVR